MSETKALDITCGFHGFFALELVPKTSLTLNIPERRTIDNLRNPSEFDIEIPVYAEYKNLPDNTECELTWLIKKDGEDAVKERAPIVVKLKQDDDSNCHFELNGTHPTINIVKDDLIGMGELGYKITPDFPHADAVELTPGILKFANILNFEINGEHPLSLGDEVTFTPKMSELFENVLVRVEFFESDSGEGEMANDDDFSVAHEWENGDRSPWTFALGFTDRSCSRMVFPESSEEGDYEFGHRIKVSIDGGESFPFVKEEEGTFTDVKKLQLEYFRLEFDERLFIDDIKAMGKVANLKRGLALPIQISLIINPEFRGPMRNEVDVDWQTTYLNDDGAFELSLISKYFFSSESLPSKDSILGLFRFAPSILPENKRDGNIIASIIDYDEEKNTGKNNDGFATKSHALWISSSKALSFKSGKVFQVVLDKEAWIRSYPDFTPTGKNVPYFTKVKVIETKNDYVNVEGLDGTAYGWTKASNLGSFYKDDPELLNADLPPSQLVTIDPSWGNNDIRKALAETYNRLGSLMSQLADQTGIDVAAVLAVWYVESAGRKHTRNKAIIRFENHLFYRKWGSNNETTYNTHFQHGGHNGISGKPWKKHTYRKTASGSFLEMHSSGGQNREYDVLEFSKQLSDATTAYQSISIGGPQILILHYRMIGYETPEMMYNVFQKEERSHVFGFFDFCNYKFGHLSKRGKMIEYLKSKNWVAFATGYNGSGKAQKYGKKIKDAYEKAQSFLSQEV